MPYLRYLCWIVLTVFVLSACSGSDESKNANQSQGYYFLESLKLVESAGRKLQSQVITADELKTALSTMDDGIKLAFQVEAEFLDGIDSNLARFYQRFFVEGVQAYRLGIEAGDRKEQEKGLELLMQWSKYWSGAREQVTEKLQSQL